MSLVIHQYEYGGPEALTIEEETVGDPGPDEVRLRQHAVGVNFIDLAFRSGQIPSGGFPLTLGVEGAGEIESVGSDVIGFAPGDRVAYTLAPGAYAAKRVIPSSLLVRLPDDVSFEVAAAITTTGLLAGTLVDRVARVTDGSVVLVHAAAGGAGSLITRWARARGATVIGTVGSQDKVAEAREGGADPVLVLDSGQDLSAEVHRLTGGRGVDAVFDGVGAATLDLSLRAVADGGSVLMFGNASGPASPDQSVVADKHIRFSTPDLGATVPDPAERQLIADELFRLLSAKRIPAPHLTTYPLKNIADAHRDLESRRSTGSLVLTV